MLFQIVRGGHVAVTLTEAEKDVVARRIAEAVGCQTSVTPRLAELGWATGRTRQLTRTFGVRLRAALYDLAVATLAERRADGEDVRLGEMRLPHLAGIDLTRARDDDATKARRVAA